MVPSKSNIATLEFVVGVRFTPYRHVFLGPRGFNHWKHDSLDTPGFEPDASGLVKNGWTVGGRGSTQHDIHEHVVAHTFLSLRRGRRCRYIRIGLPFLRGSSGHVVTQVEATRYPAVNDGRNNEAACM